VHTHLGAKVAVAGKGSDSNGVRGLLVVDIVERHLNGLGSVGKGLGGERVYVQVLARDTHFGRLGGGGTPDEEGGGEGSGNLHDTARLAKGGEKAFEVVATNVL
jgi:hypothetical protein